MTQFMHRCLVAFGLILFAGCAIKPLQPESATARPPVRASPSIPVPTWTPFTEPAPTFTLVSPTAMGLPETTRQPTAASRSTQAGMACPKEELDPYLAAVDPLVYQYLQQAKIAQTLEGLDEQEIEADRDLAQQRLETLRELVPPGCARASHARLVQGFEKLVLAWEAGGRKDFEEGKKILRLSYEDIAEAMAILAGY